VGQKRKYVAYSTPSVYLYTIEKKASWRRSSTSQTPGLSEKYLERDQMESTGCNDGLDSFVKIPTIKFTKLFINGEFIDSISGFQFSPSLSG
jgi:hypothetical protein